MARTELPLQRDGRPEREFAFWLRDLRNRSGLTYEQLAKMAHYATSTVQAATSGERLPTLRVVMAFVKACNGDLPAWRVNELGRTVRRYADQVSELLGGARYAERAWVATGAPA